MIAVKLLSKQLGSHSSSDENSILLGHDAVLAGLANLSGVTF